VRISLLARAAAAVLATALFVLAPRERAAAQDGDFLLACRFLFSFEAPATYGVVVNTVKECYDDFVSPRGGPPLLKDWRLLCNEFRTSIAGVTTLQCYWFSGNYDDLRFWAGLYCWAITENWGDVSRGVSGSSTVNCVDARAFYRAVTGER
jgi:hypothetical protein